MRMASRATSALSGTPCPNMDRNSSITEAAAATAVAMGDGAGPAAAVPVFRMDEPFLFALCDRQSGIILFLGRVTDPS